MTEATCAPTAALFERLKLETQPWHDQIENDLNLLRPGLSRADYTRLLSLFYGFYQPWETAVEPAVSCIPGLAGRCQKARLLRYDLRYLGWSDEVIAGIGLCPGLPALTSLPHILGSFYVLEGATLGGQILARHFIPKLNLERGGCRFFGGYGSETGQKWKEFRNMVGSCSSPRDHDTIIGSARETFDLLHGWLCAKDPSLQ